MILRIIYNKKYLFIIKIKVTLCLVGILPLVVYDLINLNEIN